MQRRVLLSNFRAYWPSVGTRSANIPVAASRLDTENELGQTDGSFNHLERFLDGISGLPLAIDLARDP